MKLYPAFSSLALALALTALTSPPLHASTGPGVSWQAAAADADIDRYFVQAKAEKKPVLLYWGAKWCPPCNQLKATLFNRADFIEQSKAFVAVGIDGDGPGAQKLGTRFKVRGYPTLILFSPAGNEITRLPGANWAPFFHPSGEKILFSSNHHTLAQGGREFDLFLVDLDGGDPERVTFSGTFDAFPMFSPDGTRLVFASNRRGDRADSRDTNVFVADWVDEPTDADRQFGTE